MIKCNANNAYRNTWWGRDLVQGNYSWDYTERKTDMINKTCIAFLKILYYLSIFCLFIQQFTSIHSIYLLKNQVWSSIKQLSGESDVILLPMILLNFNETNGFHCSRAVHPLYYGDWKSKCCCGADKFPDNWELENV